MASIIEALIDWIWTRLTDKPATKYPVLVGVPLMLLPVLLLAGAVYLMKR